MYVYIHTYKHTYIHTYGVLLFEVKSNHVNSKGSYNSVPSQKQGKAGGLHSFRGRPRAEDWRPWATPNRRGGPGKVYLSFQVGRQYLLQESSVLLSMKAVAVMQGGYLSRLHQRSGCELAIPILFSPSRMSPRIVMMKLVMMTMTMMIKSQRRL